MCLKLITLSLCLRDPKLACLLAPLLLVDARTFTIDLGTFRVTRP